MILVIEVGDDEVRDTIAIDIARIYPHT